MQKYIRRLKSPSDAPLEVLMNMEIGVGGSEDEIEAALIIVAEALAKDWFVRMTDFDERITVEWRQDNSWRPGFELDRMPGITVMTVLNAFAGYLPTFTSAPESKLTWPAGHFKIEYGGRPLSAVVQSQRIPGGAELLFMFDDGKALEFELASKDEQRRIIEDMHLRSEGTLYDNETGETLYDLDRLMRARSTHPLVPLLATRTVTVRPGKDLYSKSITYAIEDARPGTRFIVSAGYYEEELEIPTSVQIIGEGADRVHIASTHDSCLCTGAPRSLIRGVQFELNLRRRYPPKNAVTVTAGESLFENCEIMSNSLTCVAVVGEHANPTFRGCKIHSGAAGGIEFGNQSAGLVEDCDIVDNTTAGVRIVDGAKPSILGCRIQRNGNYAVLGDTTAGGRVENCDLTGNARGAFGLQSGHSVTGRDNVV